MEKIVSLEHEGDPKALFAALRVRLGQFYRDGEEKGVNFSLEVAINALRTLGERESGTSRLKEAEATIGRALKEWTRERVPLGWAMTQMNLGNALWRLGERESGAGKLEEAVFAYREALKEGDARDEEEAQAESAAAISVPVSDNLEAFEHGDDVLARQRWR